MVAQLGNDVTCMDAIHKTVKYGIPCFLLFVHRLALVVSLELLYHNMRRRNSSQKGYPSSQNGILIGNLVYFMMDKSAAELRAVAAVHPSVLTAL